MMACRCVVNVLIIIYPNTSSGATSNCYSCSFVCLCIICLKCHHVREFIFSLLVLLPYAALSTIVTFIYNYVNPPLNLTFLISVSGFCLKYFKTISRYWHFLVFLIVISIYFYIFAFGLHSQIGVVAVRRVLA